MKSLVTEIQRFSVHDGPGIRTTVFLKGCPLNCRWCHNPECISFDMEELYDPEKCIGCGRCDEGCYAGARVRVGREMSPEEVLREVLRDKVYYGREGGLTVSGGEPLAHPEFTRELLRLAREAGISTAIETTLYRYDEEIFSLCDLVMTDVKLLDENAHKFNTGVGNRAILENLKRLSDSGKPIIERTPIIPTVNDDADTVRGIRDMLRTLPSVKKYELMPYHPLGVSKAKALGRDQEQFTVPSKELMELLRKNAEL